MKEDIEEWRELYITQNSKDGKLTVEEETECQRRFKLWQAMNIYGYPPETKQEKVTVLIRLSLLKDKEIEQHIMTLLKNVNTESEIEEALQTVKRANELITKYNVTSDNWSIYDEVIHQMQRIEEVTKEKPYYLCTREYHIYLCMLQDNLDLIEENKFYFIKLKYPKRKKQ